MTKKFCDICGQLAIQGELNVFATEGAKQCAGIRTVMAFITFGWLEEAGNNDAVPHLCQKCRSDLAIKAANKCIEAEKGKE